MAVLFTATSFIATATPVATPAISGGDPVSGLLREIQSALAPKPADALGCASNPGFNGHLTSSSASTTDLARTTTGSVYGHISLVGAAWSCTAFIRYSGLAWNVNATQGVHKWGNLINSTSVPCNWVVGETNYLKKNSGATCHTSDAQFAMNVALTDERVYQADFNHDSEGDIAFEHSDCTSYYGDDPIKGSEGSPSNFSTTNTANRPGVNCDPNDIDSFGGSHTTVYDKTLPALAFDSPAIGTGPTAIPSAFSTVQFDATDGLAGFGGANGWTLQRQIATWSAGACGTFSNDGAAVTGTTNTANQQSGQSLLVDKCYQWILDATDQNGNSPAAITSGTIRTDTSNVLGLQGHHRSEGWDLGAGDSLSVNPGSGNVVISHPIVSLPIRGSSVDIGLTYNSHDASNVGFGPGWRLNVQRRLKDNGDGTVTFTDSDGSRHTFDDISTISGVTTYTRPATMYATLVKDTSISANEFVLTYRDLALDKFDILGSEGILVRSEDRFANGVTLAYVGATNRITTITDTAGSRTIDFAYDGSNRLTSITDWAYVSSGVVQTGATGSRRATRFFYDGSSNLSAWADPLYVSGSCGSLVSHVTCLTLTSGLVSAIGKTQTYETISGSPLALGSAQRLISTTITYNGSDVTVVKDAEEVAQGWAGTTFGHPGVGQTQVVRLGDQVPADGTSSLSTATTYALVSATDSLGRINSVKRKLASTWIEQLTAYDATYPTEPASVIENNGALLSTPARTTAWTYVASSLGLVSRMTEALTATTNRTTDFTYNSNNNVTQKIVALDASGSIRTITRYCYDPNDPTCATSGASTLTMSRQIANYVDGTAGNGSANVEDVTTAFTSDAYGQTERETRSNYNAAGTLLDSAATGHTYDSLGNLTSAIANYIDGSVDDPGDDITPNATTNARTDLTSAYTYDTAGNEVSSADPRRAIEDAKGTSLATDDFIGRSTFDALDQRLTEQTPTTPNLTITCTTPSPDCRLSSTTYDELGAVLQTVDFGNLVTASAYDRAGNAITSFEDPPDIGGVKPADTTSESTFDASGRILTTKDQVQVDDTTRGATEFAYDELGRQIASAEAVGTTSASETDTSWDALDRAKATTIGVASPTSQTTTTMYDLAGRAITVDDEFACTATTYDYRDFATQSVEGLPTGTCSGTSLRTITHTPDGLARLTKSEVTAGAGIGDIPAQQTFDGAGRVPTSSSTVAATSATTTVTATFSPLDAVIVETRSDGSRTRTIYDPVGNPTDRCYWAIAPNPDEPCQPVGGSFGIPPTRHTSSTFDARNNRVTLVDAATSATTIYDPDHNYLTKSIYVPTKMTGTAVDVELQSTFSYDERHRLAGISHQTCTRTTPASSTDHSCTATTATGSVTYGYDQNDNRTLVNENNGATSAAHHYCHDPLDRLQYRNSGAACSAGAKDEEFVYDDAGNRTKTIIGTTSPVTTTFGYDPQGQLCKVSAATPTDCTSANVTYDSAGRTTAAAGWWFTYDADGRLIKACESATCATTADKLEMVYDAEGRRTKLISDPAGAPLATTREFRYQGDAIVEEQVDGIVSRSYLVDESGSVVQMVIPAGQPEPAGTYLVTWNGHGDALALYRLKPDGSLEIANSFTYGSWGLPASKIDHLNSANANLPYGDLGFRFLYVGEFDVQWDRELGLDLYYMHARHYSPATARFIQPDPDRSEANLYAYAANNPVTEIDPDGTCFIVCVIIGAVVDTAVYMATTDSSKWNVGDAAGAVVSGAVESAVNPFAKIGKVTKLVSAAQKVFTKFSKAGRVAKKFSGGAWRSADGRFAKSPFAKAKPSRASKHGNSHDSDRVTTLYAAYSKQTGAFRKYGITSNIKKRYSARSDYDLRTIRSGTRRMMAAQERRRVMRFGGPDNLEPWSRSRPS
jgi:RHS repeat-associated protein